MIYSVDLSNIRRWALSFLLTAMLGDSYVWAHSPHDVIEALAISDRTDGEPVIFAAVSRNLLMRSLDGGASWKDMVNGLDNRFPFTGLATAGDSRGRLAVFASTGGDGIYRSLDGGDHWSRANEGLLSDSLSDVLVFPDYEKNNSVLTAGESGGLFVSRNRGDSWEQILGADFVARSICFCEPGNSELIVVGGAGGTIVISRDGGKRWQEFASLRESGAITGIVMLGQGNSATYLVATELGGIYRGIGFNNGFTASNTGLEDLNIRSLLVTFNADGRSRVNLSTWRGGVYASNDLGLSWHKKSQGLTTHPQADQNSMHRAPQFRMLKASYDRKGIATLYLGAFTGLYRSSHDIENWMELETLSAKRIMYAAISPATNNEFHYAITTYGGGAYLLRNSGQDWKILNYGLVYPRLTGIAFSPAYKHDQQLFAGGPGELLAWDSGIGRWNSISLQPRGFAALKRRILGFMHHRLGLPRSMTTDFITPEEAAKPFPGIIQISPNYLHDSLVFFGSRRNGLLSMDIAEDQLNVIMDTPNLVGGIALSPQFGDDGILLTTVQAEGVYKSTDAGSSWVSANNGLDALQVWRRQISGKDRAREAQRLPYFATHLAIGENSAGNSTIFAATGEGLYESVNFGKQWKRRRIIDEGHLEYITAVALAPGFATEPKLIVSLKGRGLFQSADGGVSFKPFAEQLRRWNQAIVHLNFSPDYPGDQTIYAASQEEVFRTIDSGETWSVVPRPVRYEDTRSVIRYTGEWKRHHDSAASGGGIHYSNSPGSRAQFRFVGTGVRWLSASSQDFSAVRLYINGERYAIDGLSHTLADNSGTTVSITGLEYGPHELVIELARQPGESGEGSNSRITVDALDLLGSHQQRDH